MLFFCELSSCGGLLKRSSRRNCGCYNFFSDKAFKVTADGGVTLLFDYVLCAPCLISRIDVVILSWSLLSLVQSDAY
jgi:hypothetical protein